MDKIKVSSARKHITIDIPSLEGGKIELIRSLTVQDKLNLQNTLTSTESNSYYSRIFAMVKTCFVQWNLQDEGGGDIPFDETTFASVCSEIDLLYIVQVLSGQQLVSDDLTRTLTAEEISKKGLSA